MPLLSLILLLPAQLAQAANPPMGLVVRLESEGQTLTGPVVLTMVSDAGEPSELILKDDGVPPDVSADNGLWSGSGVVTEGNQTLTLSAGEFTATSEALELAFDKEPNLDLLLMGDRIVRGSPPEAFEQPTPPTPPTPPAGNESNAFFEANTEGSEPDWLLYFVVFGLGGLLLGVVGYIGAGRGHREESSETLPEGVRRLPESGFFGSGTPGLTPGVSRWIVAKGEQPALLQALVDGLAKSRPVLVQGPEALALSPVWGGPVFSTEHRTAEDLLDAAEALLPDHPGLVVLTTSLEPETLTEWTAELNAVAPVWALVQTAGEGEGPLVRCQRDGSRWQLAGSSGESCVLASDDKG